MEWYKSKTEIAEKVDLDSIHTKHLIARDYCYPGSSKVVKQFTVFDSPEDVYNYIQKTEKNKRNYYECDGLRVDNNNCVNMYFDLDVNHDEFNIKKPEKITVKLIKEIKEIINNDLGIDCKLYIYDSSVPSTENKPGKTSFHIITNILCYNMRQCRNIRDFIVHKLEDSKFAKLADAVIDKNVYKSTDRKTGKIIGSYFRLPLCCKFGKDNYKNLSFPNDEMNLQIFTESMVFTGVGVYTQKFLEVNKKKKFVESKPEIYPHWYLKALVENIENTKDITYNKWLAIGTAIKNSGGTCELWEKFTEKGGHSSLECSEKWDSNLSDSINISVLRKLLKSQDFLAYEEIQDKYIASISNQIKQENLTESELMDFIVEKPEKIEIADYPKFEGFPRTSYNTDYIQQEFEKTKAKLTGKINQDADTVQVLKTNIVNYLQKFIFRDISGGYMMLDIENIDIGAEVPKFISFANPSKSTDDNFPNNSEFQIKYKTINGNVVFKLQDLYIKLPRYHVIRDISKPPFGVQNGKKFINLSPPYNINIFDTHLLNNVEDHPDVKTFKEFIYSTFEEPEYLIQWIASVVHPAKTPKTALYLYSSLMGVGKSLCAEFIANILGSNSILLGKTEDLNKNFTLQLRASKFAQVEEPTVGFSNSALDKMKNTLKNMITSDIVNVEEKHEKAVNIKQRTGFMFLSNHIRNIFIESHQDRRFAVLQAKGTHKGDVNYFKNLREIKENPERLKFIYWWLISAYDSNFNLEKIPMTNARRKAIIYVSGKSINRLYKLCVLGNFNPEFLQISKLADMVNLPDYIVERELEDFNIPVKGIYTDDGDYEACISTDKNGIYTRFATKDLIADDEQENENNTNWLNLVMDMDRNPYLNLIVQRIQFSLENELSHISIYPLNHYEKQLTNKTKNLKQVKTILSGYGFHIATCRKLNLKNSDELGAKVSINEFLIKNCPRAFYLYNKTEKPEKPDESEEFDFSDDTEDSVNIEDIQTKLNNLKENDILNLEELAHSKLIPVDDLKEQLSLDTEIYEYCNSKGNKRGKKLNYIKRIYQIDPADFGF